MHRLALLLALSAAGCALTDPEDAVTIEQGVYGLTISGCDTSYCESGRYENAPLSVTPVGGTVAVMTKSDADGFFQIPLPAGSYELCVHSCITISVANAERVRLDFESGPGGGIWCDDTGCRPR